MKKIPTLFERSEDRRSVVDVVRSGCEWVVRGQGVATRKFDGTCVFVRNEFNMIGAMTRHEMKVGGQAPDGFTFVDFDDVTGKIVGWVPFGTSGFAKYIDEALVNADINGPAILKGAHTYELCGPKVNRNPEGFDRHVLVPHGSVVIDPLPPLTYSGLRDWMQRTEFEGIVWHRADGRMVKLKKRDFPEESA